jgi:hypothetical protein
LTSSVPDIPKPQRRSRLAEPSLNERSVISVLQQAFQGAVFLDIDISILTTPSLRIQFLQSGKSSFLVANFNMNTTAA